MGTLFVGTSGYSYDDWKGSFYPEYLDKKDYLGYYNSIFNTVEINFTYYRLPNPYMFKNILKKVKGNFVFSIKSYSSMTHTRDYKQEDVKKFSDSLKPLIEEGRLGCVLFQFPWSFKFNKNNLNYLDKIRNNFTDYNLCVEFRHISWLNEETFKYLENSAISFCNVDEPQLKGLLPPTSISTSKTGYIRFHGRNDLNWWNHKYAYQRYDYLYSQDELAEWIPRIKKIEGRTEKTYIYFNNHYRAKAIKSAKILTELLKDNYTGTSQN